MGRLRIAWTSIGLLFSMSSGLSMNAAGQQLPNDGTPDFYLTAFGRNDSPAVLQENEVSVLVDKAPTQVKTVHQSKDDPLLFALLVDTSESDAKEAKSTKKAAFELFQSLTNAQRQGYLVLFSTRIATSRMPLSVAQAKEALDSARSGGGTALYDAIHQTCKQTLSRSKNPQNPRRVIVVFSDGEDNMSQVNRGTAEAAAMEEGISVFSVVVNPTVLQARGTNFLREISQRTGGLSTDEGGNNADRILSAAIDAQSAVTLATPPPGDGKVHSIKVKCTHKGVRIYAPEAALLP
jgi:Mg-chelatase subunit ChlD